jgi:hypothetical protein
MNAPVVVGPRVRRLQLDGAWKVIGPNVIVFGPLVAGGPAIVVGGVDGVVGSGVVVGGSEADTAGGSGLTEAGAIPLSPVTSRVSSFPAFGNATTPTKATRATANVPETTARRILWV